MPQQVSEALLKGPGCPLVVMPSGWRVSTKAEVWREYGRGYVRIISHLSHHYVT